MINLLNAPMLMEDELLYSYILRLALANGFLYDYRFKNYINDRDVLSQKEHFRYDTFEYLGTLFSLLNGLDWMTFFLNTTIYSLLAPLLIKTKQDALINACFTKNAALRYTPNHYLKELKSCPQCRKEMISKYGFWWYKKSHNLPLMSTCEKHGCRLEIFNGIQGHELDQESFKPLIGSLHPEFDHFIIELSQLMPDASLEDLMLEMLKVIDQAGVDVMEQKLQKSGLADLYKGTICYTRKRQLPTKSAFSYIKALILLYLCFDSVKAIPLPDYNRGDVEEFIYSTKGYKVMIPYRKTLVEMEHEACGNHFLITPHAFMNGWGCPDCLNALSSQELFQRLVDVSGHEEYKLLSPFEGLNGQVKMKHKRCGQINLVSAHDFLFEDVRCSCNLMVNREEAQRRIEPMKLIRFNSMDTNATFKCPGCGKSFTMKYSDYLKHPHCRICQKKRVSHYSQAEFKQALKDLVGTEYTLKSVYVDSFTKVTMRHNVCGQQFSIAPRDFFQGTRCPYCQSNKYMRESDFCDFVSKISLNTYKAENVSGQYCVIKNTQTGETIKMLRAVVIQELTRPTPSPKLPLRQKGEWTYVSRLNHFKSYLEDHYRAHEIIFTDDLKDAFTNEDIRSYLRGLTKQGYLESLMKGAYCFTGQTFTPDEIIEQKYIQRQGNHIGFTYGDELAYELKIIDHKPSMHMIMTNKESQTHGRLIKVLEETVKVKGSEYPVTEGNWRILQMINLLESSYRFGWDVDELIICFMVKYHYQISDFQKYIMKPHILKKLRRIVENAKKIK